MANMAHRHNNNTGYTSSGVSGGISDIDDHEELAFDHSHRGAYSPASVEPPKVSNHQPCPNHVGGKTFAEIGTQTLPKKPKQQYHPSNGGAGGSSSSSLNTLGCAAGIKQR